MKKLLLKRFAVLEKKINFHFKKKDLLIQAFVHRSFLNENKNFYLLDNERLEFLGDAVTELIVTDYLYQIYPNETEGVLTVWRASLINTQMLSKVAQELDLIKFLLLSQGEERNIQKRKAAKESILANVFEALVGAIYCDQGYKSSKIFIEHYLLPKLDNIIKTGKFRDAKSELQEYSQKGVNITPTYQVLKESGLEHSKTFQVGVFLNQKLIAKGKGTSKQRAELRAAKSALLILKRNS